MNSKCGKIIRKKMKYKKIRGTPRKPNYKKSKNQKIKKNCPPLHYLLYNLTLPHLMCQPSLSESYSKALDYLTSIGTGDVET